MDAITIILILLVLAIIAAAIVIMKRRHTGRVLIAQAPAQRRKTKGQR